jgi:hypothetical protein
MTALSQEELDNLELAPDEVRFGNIVHKLDWQFAGRFDHNRFQYYSPSRRQTAHAWKDSLLPYKAWQLLILSGSYRGFGEVSAPWSVFIRGKVVDNTGKDRRHLELKPKYDELGRVWHVRFDEPIPYSLLLQLQETLGQPRVLNQLKKKGSDYEGQHSSPSDQEPVDPGQAGAGHEPGSAHRPQEVTTKPKAAARKGKKHVGSNGRRPGRGRPAVRP